MIQVFGFAAKGDVALPTNARRRRRAPRIRPALRTDVHDHHDKQDQHGDHEGEGDERLPSLSSYLPPTITAGLRRGKTRIPGATAQE